MNLAGVIVELLGIAIFVVAFAPQAYRMWKLKHSYGMSPSSWTMNFIGRYLWVIGSLFFANGDFHMATIMLSGQGLVALLTIPMVYYSFRNSKTKGEYTKHHFAMKLFVGRMIALITTSLTIIICILVKENVIGDIDGATKSLGIGIFFVQLAPAVFTGVAFLPQTIKTLKTKKTKSISLITSLFFSIGNSLIILSIILQVIEKSMDVEYLSTWWYSIGSAIFASVSVLLMFTVAMVKLSNIRKGTDHVEETKA